ncbi:MAG: RluA family pseudouridine synthase [Pseudomonadota bacterium]
MSAGPSSPAHSASPRMQPREVLVEPDRAGQRLDNFLMYALGDVPRSLVYRLIRTGQVRVNGGRVKPMRKLITGDRVRIPPMRYSDSASKKVPSKVIEQIRASIVHRQPELIVVDKPTGLASQAGSGLSWGLNDVMAAIDAEALPVHRLDRQTSGLMVFARGRSAAKALQAAFSADPAAAAAEKRYFALLCGHLPQQRVDVDQPLKKIRDRSGQHRVVVADSDDPDGQHARSSFYRLERLPKHDFVEVRIETGRTHQIRVHAAALGCPLLGDDRYNPDAEAAAASRLFLHAGVLRLPWPMDQVFHAALPTELNDVLDCLRGK